MNFLWIYSCWKGRSIHAARQMDFFECKVHERSKVVGGTEMIETPDRCVFPLSISSGLVYITPSGFLLMMTFSNTFMSSSQHMMLQMLLFWIMALPMHFLIKSTKMLMIHCFRTLFLMTLEPFSNT